MYKWKIEIILKSGKELTVYDENELTNSGLVAKRLFEGRDNEIIGFANKDRTKNIFVRRGEMATMAISVE